MFVKRIVQSRNCVCFSASIRSFLDFVKSGFRRSHVLYREVCIYMCFKLKTIEDQQTCVCMYICVLIARSWTKLGNIGLFLLFRFFFLHVSFSNGQDDYVLNILKNRSDPHERGCSCFLFFSFIFLPLFFVLFFFFWVQTTFWSVLYSQYRRRQIIYIYKYIYQITN